MSDLQNEFINRSAADLENIANRLQTVSTEILPPNFFREVSRKLHTVKGTAQIFNLSQTSQLAHTLENLLAETQINTISADSKMLLTEGIFFLTNLLRDRNFQIPEDFAGKIEKFKIALKFADLPKNVLPEEVINKLSNGEKAILKMVTAKGGKVSILEIGFAKTSFAADFKQFRDQLEEKGEIIAALPIFAVTAENKIEFQIIFADREKDKMSENNFPDDLHEMLSNLANYGKTLAGNLEKECQIVVSTEQVKLSADDLKLIFDVLLHLIRNAVDHGIEKQGKIKISVKKSKNNLILSVSDNGNGLNADKIRLSAAKKNVISANQILTEEQIFNLIFVPEFSTAETLSEISGRGVGLDAVKNLVGNAGGKIGVTSEKGKGATFEICLPFNEISSENLKK